MPALQGTLLDAGAREGPRSLRELAVRAHLGRGAWVDLARGWLAGSLSLFDRLSAGVAWHSERRAMYDRVVDVPRLLHFCSDGDELPDPVLEVCRGVLNSWYPTADGAPFTTVGLALYRHGGDGVAWHGDTIGRGRREDTLVAILSLGESRRLLMRPRGGGRSLRYDLHSGDLLVMGGSCQRTWEHSIPKTSRPVGPRISVQFRPSGVR